MFDSDQYFPEAGSPVDSKLVDLSSIDDETRYRIFDYLWYQKRASSTDLEISPTLANKIKNRKAKVCVDSSQKHRCYIVLHIKNLRNRNMEELRVHQRIRGLQSLIPEVDK